tara:strand:+ start:316 stop:537 length:222 start_codon:yes stop_codon:yes gene_type:complete
VSNPTRQSANGLELKTIPLENTPINPQDAWVELNKRKSELMAFTQQRIKEIRQKVGDLNREEDVLLELLKKNS